MVEKIKAFFGLLCAFAVFGCIPLHADSLAVTGGTLIDGTGAKPLRDATILIEDGRITRVGAADEVAVPENATRIDARGKFVIPGLMDANVHLFSSIADLEKLYKFEGRYHEMIVEAAQLALRNGLTTVFDTWGPRAPLVRARDQIEAGERVGARIFLAGNIIGFDGPFSADFYGQAATVLLPSFVQKINDLWEQGVGRELMWWGPDRVRATVTEYAARDVDFLKYGASGHSEMFFIQFSPRVQRTIVETGHEAGFTVQAHTSSVESLDMAIDAGVDIATHCDVTGPETPMPEETIRKLRERGVACSVLPITQARLEAMLEQQPNGYITPFMKTAAGNIRKMIEGGVTLLLSTDAGIMSDEVEAMLNAMAGGSVDVDPRTRLGEGHFNALAALEEMGMAPMDILSAATANTAAAYGLSAKLGTLEAGKLADLLILDDDPLKSAHNYRSIHAVIKAGRVIDTAALPDDPIVTRDAG